MSSLDAAIEYVLTSAGRSYEASNPYERDADKDNDKRITMKITDVTRGDSDELNLELELPSIGKVCTNTQ
jgi:hypothetical protein